MRGALAFGMAVVVLGACASKPTAYQPTADREWIRKAVQPHLKELTTCYEQAIDERPGAEGKLVLQWEIAPDGSATNVRVKEADPKIQGAGDCVVKRVGAWKFPRPESNEIVEVIYPFIFSENGKVPRK